MEEHLRFTTFSGKRLHIGVCGSIASYKALDLLRRWSDAGIASGVTMTAAARRFLAPLAFEALGASPVYTAMYADRESDSLDRDIFPHLSPGASADAFILVAASASTLARLAHGLADEILSCQALAFPGPLIIAPAMNPRMWNNPATRENWEILQKRGHILVAPDSGRVACREEGTGRLAESREIYLAALKALATQDFSGVQVMATLGPTREFWDPVRFWSNPSTGLMGASLAVAAFLRGATVHALCGPGSPWLPQGIIRHDVVAAQEMYAAAKDLWPTMDTGIFTAAVADFAPEPLGNHKYKKGSAERLTLTLTPNPDILRSLGSEKKAHQKIVGFAAETGDLEREVRRKLAEKNADMLVGNLINEPGSGFGTATNSVFIADAHGRSEHLPLLAKPDLAWSILTWLSAL